MGDEATVVVSELRFECACLVDIDGFALLAYEEMLSGLHVIAGYKGRYEYLCGCYRNIRFR
jgi:hypothetical protein